MLGTTTISISLRKTLIGDTGRYLEASEELPFLKTGVTCAVFQLAGTLDINDCYRPNNFGVVTAVHLSIHHIIAIVPAKKK